MDAGSSDLSAHVARHLHRSLKEAESPTARYHIRQALQVVEACRGPGFDPDVTADVEVRTDG